MEEKGTRGVQNHVRHVHVATSGIDRGERIGEKGDVDVGVLMKPEETGQVKDRWWW
jgi:hypothetical protein